jgi:hypothetical protein
LDWNTVQVPPVACEQYEDWSKKGQFDSLSVVFATGYLSNPASFYGHILLKFNTNRAVISNDYLDESINFGAIVPNNENGVVYIIKGLFGGYDGTFSNSRFYRQNHLYAENELRDLWEYELALSKEEVDQIASHTWELLGARFKYFFLNENCAYRIAELIEPVIGEPLLSPELPWAIPVNVFNHLELINRHGMPLVRKVRLIPSRLNTFYSQYFALGSVQKNLAEKLVRGGVDLDNITYTALAGKDKISVVDTLLDYYEFRIVKEDNKIDFRKQKQEYLIERSGLPIQPELPHEDQAHIFDSQLSQNGLLPAMVRIGRINNTIQGPGIGIRFRPAYHDLLQPDAGHIPNSNLTMFDFNTVYRHDQLALRSLDVVNIETMNASRTPLPGGGGVAWKVRFGLENQNLACNHCMTVKLTGGVGKAISISNTVTALGIIDMSAHSQFADSGTLDVLPKFGLMVSPMRGWKSSLTIGRQLSLNGSATHTRETHWENRLGTDRNWDIRISFDEQIAREVQFAISTYW